MHWGGGLVTQGTWLPEVGDHPEVWVSPKSFLEGGLAAQGSRPVMPAKWDHKHRYYFGNIIKACSFADMSDVQWLHEYRE